MLELQFCFSSSKTIPRSFLLKIQPEFILIFNNTTAIKTRTVVNLDAKSGILNVPHGSRLGDQTIQQQFASLPGQLNISGVGAGTSLRGIQSEEQHQERQLNVLENLWANILGTTNTGNDVGELTMEQKQFIFGMR